MNTAQQQKAGFEMEESAVSKQEPTRVKRKKSPTAFRTISEVADELGVQQHVLRFWETKFTQVKPLKRGGGRRYYRPEDLALLQKIHHLLYTEGYTIKGVQKLLKGPGKSRVMEGETGEAANESSSKAKPEQVQPQKSQQGLSDKQRTTLETVLGELKNLRLAVKV